MFSIAYSENGKDHFLGDGTYESEEAAWVEIMRWYYTDSTWDGKLEFNSGTFTFDHCVLFVKEQQDLSDKTPLERLEASVPNSASKKNPFKKIISRPTYYDLSTPVIQYLRDILTGYVWECEEGHNFVAVHNELVEVKALLVEMEQYLKNGTMHSNVAYGRKQPFDFGEHSLVIRFALLLPGLWD